MTPDRWKQIKLLVQSALDLPKNDRLHLVKEQCGTDTKLFQEVWSLVIAYDQAEQFLDVPAYQTHIQPTRLVPPTGPTVPRKYDLRPEPGFRELHPGDVIHNRYRIQRELGRGGIGVVYLAEPANPPGENAAGSWVVIKTLLPDSTANVWLRKKFQHEMEALQRIHHPNVVSLLETGVLEDGNPFFVMPFIEGTSLREFIRPEGVPVSVAIPVLLQIGQGLQAAHEAGILHRDLKPENVLLHPLIPTGWSVKLIDFGIARIENPTSATTTGKPVTVGTLMYMAPEQITSGKTTIQTDIFSFAVLAVELFSGQKPFVISNRLSTLAAMQQLTQLHQQGFTQWPSPSSNQVTLSIQQALFKALTNQPGTRQRSICEILKVFEDQN